MLFAEEVKPNSLSKDSIRTLRIDADIPGAWEQGSFLLDDLEKSLNGFHRFQVIPRRDMEALIAKAKTDPVRRDSTQRELKDAHFPASYRLELKIRPPLFEESRVPVLFWLGRRQVRMDVDFRFSSTDGKIQELAGNYSVDTVVSMGYCGILDCVVKPMDTQMRLRIERTLYSKLVTRIRDRMEQLLVIPMEHKARMDSLETIRAKEAMRPKTKQDSIDAELVKPVVLNPDSMKTDSAQVAPAKADSAKAAGTNP